MGCSDQSIGSASGKELSGLMALSGVYAIVNRENGKRYVGSAINIPKRWREHQRGLQRGCHENSYLQGAWNKYGEGAFEFVV